MSRILACGLALFFGLAAQPVRPGSSPKPTPAPARPSALDKATLEAYLRYLFVWGPQVQVRLSDPTPSTRLPGFFEVKVHASAGAASQEETFLVSQDGRKILKALVFDVTRHPFSEELEKLRVQSQPSFGPARAPVTLVLFSDFQCGYCKEEAESLRKNVPATFPNQVRVVFKDFPLESIHPWAKPAAIAGRCIFRQQPAAFWDYHDWIYQHQNEITPENLRNRVMEFARSRLKVDLLQLQACLDTGAAAPEVEQNVADGKALGINSTPTLFVNGRRLVGNIGWNQLRQIIDYELGHQKAGHQAAWHCCEVAPLSPAKE